MNPIKNNDRDRPIVERGIYAASPFKTRLALKRSEARAPTQ